MFAHMGINKPPLAKMEMQRYIDRNKYFQNLKSKNMTQIESLQMQTGDHSPKPTENLFKTKKIDGTPFSLLSRDGLYYLTLGNNLLSPPKQSEEEIAVFIKENSYNIITSLILILIEKQDEWREPKNGK